MDVGTLISEGCRVCFDDDGDIGEGRQLLELAASLGRDDARFYLGKSFEKEGDFASAESSYEMGLDAGFRPAVFRLALLHGGAKVIDHDRSYYLRTMRKLSGEGHLPSMVLYTRERILGSYGVPNIAIGLLCLFPRFVVFMFWYLLDPTSYRFNS